MSMQPTLVEIGSFDYRGRRLAYEIYGHHGQPCVLLHGILLDALVNRELALRFAAEGYRVALLDLLGHGRSERSRDPKDHRTDFYADQVLALLDHLGWPQALIGGVSLGAITALQVAVRAPRRVRALFLEMPVLEWSAPWATVILAPILFAARVLRPGYRRLGKALARMPRPREAWLASLLNAVTIEPETAAAILHGVMVGPIAPTEMQRQALTMPVLVVGHTGDWLHDRQDAEALAWQIPGARLVLVRHVLELRTNPDRPWPEIREFLRQIATAADDGKPRRHSGRAERLARPTKRMKY
ncbi:MAG: alpha/beta fold hydrolase [Gammaproteobacteria bacterium]|nr:alpha/beta fold hydrolase [Gammaproteobacteria bacterium]